MTIKNLKRNARASLKSNYLNTVVSCFLGLLLLSYYSLSSSALQTGIECIQNYYDNGHFMTNTMIYYLDSNLDGEDLDFNELYKLSSEELREQGFNESAINFIHSLNENANDKDYLVKRFKVKDGIMKPLLSLANSDLRIITNNIEDLSSNIITKNISVETAFSVVLSILSIVLFRSFFINPLEVGYSRFFLENTTYHSTRIARVFSSFKNNYLTICRKMFRKTIYQFLWNFTIIGGIIKSYSYRLVPYIIAEDNEISSKDAILISRKLMNGNKLRAFFLDLSFFFWHLLSVCSFGLIGIFFANPYSECTKAEFYKSIVNEKLFEKFYKDYLKGRIHADNNLYINDTKRYYPNTEPSDKSFAIQDYSATSLIILFFIFSFIGWCMEVSLFLLKTHTFVNRGTLYGPWLPIYGCGCVLILIIFTKTKLKYSANSPMVIFVNIMIICGLLEYFTSWALEVTTGLKYWDYSGHFLAINGRICFENLCEFGLGGLICIYLISPRLNTLIKNSDTKKLKVFIVLLTLLFLTDFSYVKNHPNLGYGITDPIIDDSGNIIKKSN